MPEKVLIDPTYRPHSNRSLAEHIEDHVDTLAARITALGGTANGTISVVSRTSSLSPYPTEIREGVQHVDALSGAVATFGAKVRKGIDDATRAGDADTADLFTGIYREIDKDLWFLEAHLHAKR